MNKMQGVVRSLFGDEYLAKGVFGAIITRFIIRSCVVKSISEIPCPEYIRIEIVLYFYVIYCLPHTISSLTSKYASIESNSQFFITYTLMKKISGQH